MWHPRSWLVHARDGRAWSALAHAVVSMLLTWSSAALVAGLAASALLAPVAALSGQVSVPHVSLPFLVVPVAAWGAALVAQGTTLLQVRLGRALLGARSRADLERAARAAEQRASVAEDRAEHLRATRSAAVAAADEERRRIERDLHDGAQQRLVALGVELGAARRAAAHDPQAAVAALDAAHGEVKEVLAELRDLVRGVHPAVLTDRGLDAALSALSARSPVPVDVDVELPDGVGPQAQAAAYFVVAEVAGIQGDADVRASDGDVTLREVQGSVSVDARDGDVLVKNAGAGVQVRTRDGATTVAGAVGNVDVRASDGHVDLRGVRGATTVQATDGHVQVADASGDVEVGTRDGDITVHANSSGQPVAPTIETEGRQRIEAPTDPDALVRVTLRAVDGDVAYLEP